MNGTSTKRGFTLVELAIVVAVIAILVAVAVTNLWRLKPRASLAGAGAELQAMLHQARQTALATGTPVVVLVYPSYTQAVAGLTSKGYLIVYQDACFDFFTATPPCGVKFATYDPGKPASGNSATAQSQVLDSMSLPYSIVVGPTAGMGAGATLPAPLNNVPVNSACTFCGTTAGAVQFDAQGRATYYSLSGTTQTGPLADTGGGQSLSLGYDQTLAPLAGQRTVVILSGSGAVETIAGG